MNVNYNSTYGFRSVNTQTAFDIGYEEATQGRGSDNPAMSVKTRYEQQLRNYLKQLPDDMDLTQIPDKYRGKISEFLTKKKAEYVRDAGIIDELVVGAEDYMETVANMNRIKNTFENLDKQFQIYGQNKKTIIEDIENQTTSLYGENQANINLLRSVYNEEYDLKIDDNGNLSFIGDDGEIKMGDLPDYGIKDYETASAMTKFGVDVYQNGYKSGLALTKENPQYFQISNQLKTAIDRGGKNTLMSILHDGLIGDVVMANDPVISGYIQDFNAGNIQFAQLRDIVVDNYMNILLKQSKLGVSNRPKRSRGRRSSGTGSGGNLTATDRKAFNTVSMLADAFDKKDNIAINRLLPNNISVEEDKENEGTIIVNGVDIKYNTEQGFLDLLDQAKIDPIYWPEQKGEANQSNTGGGSFNEL